MITRREAIGLGAATLGALGIGYYLREGRPVGRDVSEFMDVPALLDAPGFPFEGPDDAAVTMLVFSDYACGVCRKVEPLWRAAVREAEATDAPVRVVHRDWPILGPASVRAARMALACGRQGLYEPVHQVLMRTGRHDEVAVRQALVAAGGDWVRLERDLAADAEAIDRLLARTAQVAAKVPVLVATRSARGAIAVAHGERADVAAEPVERVVDTTGAGDLFAAGFLTGHARGESLERCLKMGAICASEVISHYGARPEADLAALVEAKLS